MNIVTMYMKNITLKFCYGCLKEKHEGIWLKTILIFAGGLGGFGLELADWLVLRGARKLVLSSRTGISTGYQSLRVKVWRSYGATVVISLADITTESGVRDLLSDANKLGQVDAIFNLAVVSVMLLCVC
jgi:NAD(P)-dependent dehydrogenase (short-subunit alcohol dehydrogenase family)